MEHSCITHGTVAVDMPDENADNPGGKVPVGGPLVAVVIPAWNRLEDTLSCLRSLGETGYPDLAIIVVDNGSDSNFGGAIRCKYPNAIVVRSEINLGFVGGVNLGATHALSLNPDYLFFLNNDTVVDKAAIHVLVNSAQSYPNYQIFSPVITFYDNPNLVWFGGGIWDPERARIQHAFLRCEVSKVPAETFQTSWANGCALFVSRQVYETVGPFDPAFFALWDEIEWCFRAASFGFHCAIEPTARIAHKESSTFGSRQTPLYTYLKTRNRLLVIRKFFGELRFVVCTSGQTIVAIRMLVAALIRRDSFQLKLASAMMQGNVDALLGNVGTPRLWYQKESLAK